MEPVTFERTMYELRNVFGISLWNDKVKVNIDFKNHFVRCAIREFGTDIKQDCLLKSLYGCHPRKPFYKRNDSYTNLFDLC